MSAHPIARAKEQTVARKRTAAKDVMGMLRAHRGRRFDVEQLERLTGHPARDIRKVLVSRYSDGRYGLRRDAHGEGQFQYWLNDQVAAPEGDSPNGRVIARWMLKNPRAVMPTLVARATGLAPAVVAQQLEQWVAQGNAVRCELVMRAGIDRFEYRLTFGAVSEFGGRKRATFQEKFL